MIIRIDGNFRGITPGVSPHLLDPSGAQVATNCLLDSGALQAMRGLTTIATPTKAGTKRSLYLFANSYWFHWLDDVDCVPGPIPGDTSYRTYFTGDGVPKMTYSPLAITGGTNYPVAAYTLGIPVPASTMTAAVSGSITDTDPLLVESWTYLLTYVSALGEEGPPCNATIAADRAPGQTLTLSNIPVAPVGAYNITHKRLYRRATGSNGSGEWLLWQNATYPDGSIPIAITTVADATDTVDLLTVTLASATWDGPPAGLKGLINLPGGSLAGFVGNEWCVSVPYMPHAWPVEYRITLDNPIVSHGAFGSSVLVTTTGAPCIITGIEPGSMSVEKSEVGQACVSKRGTVDLGTAIAYPSPEGLILIGVGVAQNITQNIFGRDGWTSLNPSSFEAWNYKGKYLCCYNNGTPGMFILDPNSGTCIMMSGITATAGCNDQATGKLYLQVGSNIVQFDSNGSSLLTYTWRSKPFTMLQPGNFGVGLVRATSYPLTLKIISDGVLKHTQTVANANPFRLPSGFRASSWELELSGTATVQAVYLASSYSELAGL